ANGNELNNSSNPSKAEIQRSLEKACGDVSDIAENIQRIHQKGARLSEFMSYVMNGLRKSGYKNPQATRHMILDAWNEPRYSSNAMQQRVIGDFADRYYKDCIESRQ